MGGRDGSGSRVVPPAGQRKDIGLGCRAAGHDVVYSKNPEPLGRKPNEVHLL